MDKVSIAIATYNGAKALREQLDSLYNQTVQPDEIFVSDDCSNDGTVEILEEYHRTKGLKYTVNEHNLGFNKNFENALKNTTGEFIMICDQDDIWMPEKVEVLLKAIKKHDCTKPVLVTSTTKDYMDGKVIRDNTRPRMSWLQMLYGNNTQGCCTILNRVLLNKALPIDVPKGSLYDGYLGMIAGMTGEWENIGTPLMYYRHHANNVIANNDKRTDQYPNIFAADRFLLMDAIEAKYGKDFIPERRKVFEKVKKLGLKKSKLSRITATIGLVEVPFITRMKCIVKICLQ
ncbi:MAG: glycosyltransferase [Paludibacteraceae bacterium]|nr:glycosyltransferase [Paludibacteraceae bacterium]MBR6041168.1 glycosyltransferase [Paludibacteraceae bacterium]